GLLIPVWELAPGTEADELAGPCQQLDERLTAALAETEPLDAEARRARAGIVSRQVTLRWRTGESRRRTCATDPPVATLRDVTGRAQTQRVAVIIPAKDESGRIAATVRAARAIPHVDLVLVVDDGSTDNTQDVARAAGAVVVRHSVNRGK